MTNKRAYNFSAGPSMLPVDVIEDVAKNLVNYNGCGESVMEMSHRSAEFKKILKDAEDNLRETIKLEGEYEQKLKELGVNFHEVDGEAFNKAVAPVYSKFPKWTPGIYDEIMKELTKIREDIKNGK